MWCPLEFREAETMEDWVIFEDRKGNYMLGARAQSAWSPEWQRGLSAPLPRHPFFSSDSDCGFPVPLHSVPLGHKKFLFQQKPPPVGVTVQIATLLCPKTMGQGQTEAVW